MAIRSLDASSIHALTSGQVVTSLASAVKELLENSLDAGATSIDIRLLGAHGTSGFSVSDNGCGIPASEYDVVAKKHYTSKLASFDDLATVRTFGFRGEALASVCALSEKVTITTAVEADAPLATVLELDNAGNVLDRSKKVARQRGTTVQAANLFCPLPVRRKLFVSTAKREFPKLLSLLTAYALVPCTQENRGVRLNVTSSTDSGKNSKTTSHIRTSGQPSLSSAISTLWGSKQLTELSPLQLDFSVDLSPPKSALKRPRDDLSKPKPIDVKVRGYISNPAMHNSGRAQTDRQYFFINGRPCSPLKIQKTISEVFRSLSPSSSASSSSFPVVVADFILPTDCMDINVSPDKRTILLHGEDILVNALREALESAFSSSSSSSFAVQPTQTQANTISKASTISSRHSSFNPRKSDESVDFEMIEASDEIDQEIVATAVSSPSPIPEPQGIELAASLTAGDLPRSADRSPIADENQCSVPPAKSKQVQLTLSTASASWSLSRQSSDKDRAEIGGVRAPIALTSSANPADVDVDEPPRPAKKARTAITDYYSSANVKEEDAPVSRSRSAREQFRGKLLSFASQSTSVSSQVDELMSDEDEESASKGVENVEGDTDDAAERALDPEADMDEPIVAAINHPPNPDHEKLTLNISNTLSPAELLQEPSPLKETPLFLDSPPPTRSSSPAILRTSELGDDVAIKTEEESSRLQIDDLSEPDSSVPGIEMDDPRFTTDDEVTEEGDDADEETNTLPEVLRPHHFPLNTQSLAQTIRVDDQRIAEIYNLLASSSEDHGQPIWSGSNLLETVSKDVPPSASPTLALRVIHKQDFLSVSTPSSTPSVSAESMSIVGQFNLGFIVVRLVRRRKAHVKKTSQTSDSQISNSSDEIPSSERDENNDDGQTDDLFIIDQHAADEKYNFETLQATTRIDSQKLVRPRPLELTAADELIAIENADVLRENGFEISVDNDDEDDDDDEVRVIRNPQTKKSSSGHISRVTLVSQPVSGKVDFDMKDLEELLELLQDRPTPSNTEGASKPRRMVRCSKARAMFASRACRKSVMIGKALTKPQMTSIVRHMGTMDQPWNCPHGRPTMRHLVSLGGDETGESQPGSLGYVQRPVEWAHFSVHRKRNVLKGAHFLCQNLPARDVGDLQEGLLFDMYFLPFLS